MHWATDVTSFSVTIRDVLGRNWVDLYASTHAAGEDSEDDEGAEEEEEEAAAVTAEELIAEGWVLSRSDTDVPVERSFIGTALHARLDEENVEDAVVIAYLYVSNCTPVPSQCPTH